MEVKQNPAQLKDKSVNLAFVPDFSSKQYELFEIDNILLEQILKGNQNLQIKSYTNGMTKTAALSSNESTFKLKKSETSNTFFVAGLKTGQIYKQTSITIDLEKSQTNKYQLARTIIQYPILSNSEDENQSEIEYIQGISKAELLKQCQMSEKELDDILNSQEAYEFFIIQSAPQTYSFLDPLSLYELIDSLLIFLNSISQTDGIRAKQIQENNDGIIKDRYLKDSRIIEYALNYIADPNGDDSYKLNSQKITKSIALAMLYVKGDYYLNEFITALKHAIDLAMPFEQSSLDADMDDDSLNKKGMSDYSNNLFEQYCNYDLSFLKGSAIILPVQELRMVNKQDDVIRLLHPYYSQEFEFCYNSPEKRLDALFDIKDKWTQQELSQYLKSFIDQNVNFDNYLIKNTKIIKEKNPFNQTKDIAYYMKKF